MEWLLSHESGVTAVYLVILLVWSVLVVFFVWILFFFAVEISPKKIPYRGSDGEPVLMGRWCAFFLILLVTQLVLTGILALVTWAVWSNANPLTVDGLSSVHGRDRSSLREPISLQLVINGTRRRERVVNNWGQSISFEPKEILFPTSEEEVSHMVLEISLNVNDNENENEKEKEVDVVEELSVIGSGHSYSPLVSTGGTCLCLDRMTDLLSLGLENETVCVQAGIKIMDLNRILFPHGYCVRGFGSIQGQTIGGASSTSLHGALFESFTTHLVSVNLVVANGTVLELNEEKVPTEMAAVRAGLGVLGVITSACLKIHPIIHLSENSTILPLFDFLRNVVDTGKVFNLPGEVEAVEIVAGLRNRESDAVVTTYHRVPPPNSSPVVDDFPPYQTWLVNGLDGVAIPMLSVFPSLSTTVDFASLVAFSVGVGEREVSLPLPFSWQHFPIMGMLYTEYSIPLSNCSKAIRALLSLSRRSRLLNNHHTVNIQMRFLKRYDGAALGFSYGSDVCTLEVYSLISESGNPQFFQRWENLLHRYGGTSHWGTAYFGRAENQAKAFPEFERFNRTRTEFDPRGIFLNDFTRELFAVSPHTNSTLVTRTNSRYSMLSTMSSRSTTYKAFAILTIVIPPILVFVMACVLSYFGVVTDGGYKIKGVY